MCDCFHLAFPNWHAASSGTGAGRRLRGPEPGTEDDSVCDEPSQFAEGERPRPQGSSPVEEYPEKYSDSDKEFEAERDPHYKSGKKMKKSGFGSIFEKHSTPKMSKLKQEAHSPESGVIVKTAKDGCAEGLVYGGGGRDGIFIKEVVPESPASKSLKLKEGDQVLSATVYFDNMSYEDAIQILEHAQAYKVKLCLKRNPETKETEPATQSDVIHEEELSAPEMREQRKSKRRSDARISWPKFSSLGRGRKSHFTRSHSSSEADEQRTLELSPTTSDTESPIKSQDALKGKKRHRNKLCLLPKRGRVSSSEDQDTDTPTAGQISGEVLQTNEVSDMIQAEGLESPPRKEQVVFTAEGTKIQEDLQKDQNLGEAQVAQRKAELISIDSTLKTAELDGAKEDKENTGVKSPGEKKKKKERSELKMKILGKDKSNKKDTKAKSSPKRLKTIGASIEKPDLPTPGTDTIQSLESQIKQHDLLLDVNTNTTGGKSTKADTLEVHYPQGKLDISKEHLPKREEIEIPGMEDMSARSRAKVVQEPNAKSMGLYEENHSETVQLSIDVDSVKEAISKLPGYKLPKMDTSGVPIPEEITVIDANAQRISVKTPTKVVHTTEREERHLTKFDMISSSEMSKTTVKLPKITQSPKIIKIEAHKREEIVIPGKESKQGREEISPKKSDKKSKKEKTKTDSFGITKPDFKIPDIGIDLPRQNTTQEKSGAAATSIPDMQSFKSEMEGKIDGVISDVKVPEIDSIEYIDSEGGSPAKKDRTLTGTAVTKLIDDNISDSSHEGGQCTMPKVKAGTLDKDTQKIDTELKFEGEFDKKGAKFKMPKFGIKKSKAKGTENDINLSKDRETTKLSDDKSEPKISEAVESDVIIPENTEAKESQEKEKHKSKFKMPKIKISMPKVQKDGEVKISGSDRKDTTDAGCKDTEDVLLSKIPTPAKLDQAIETEIDVKRKKDSAEVELPHVDYREPIDERGANESLSQFEIPTYKLPIFAVLAHVEEEDVSKNVIAGGETKMTVQQPAVNINAPSFEASLDEKGDTKGTVKVSITDMSIKNKVLSLPQSQVEVTMPECSIQKVDKKISKTKDIPEFPKTVEERNSYDLKFKTPTFGMTEGILPKSKYQQELSITKRNEDGSDLTTLASEESPSKFEMPTLKMPKFGIATPSVSVQMPDLDKEKTGEPNILEEELKVELKLPKTEMETHSTQFKTLETEHEGKSNFKRQGLGISVPQIKRPDIDVSLLKEDVKVTIPEAEAEVTLPDVELKQPSIDIKNETPDIQVTTKVIEGSPLKFKMPTFKLPKFGIAIPTASVEVSGSDKGEKNNKVKLTVEELTVNKKPSKTEMEALSIQMKAIESENEGKGSKFKMPSLGFSVPQVKKPDIDFSLPQKDVEVTIQEATADVSLPDVRVKQASADIEMKAPEIQITTNATEGPSSKFKMPTFQVPKFGIATPSGKNGVLDQCKGEKMIEVEENIPEAELTVDIKPLKIEMETPSIQMETVEGEHEEKGRKFKMPSLGISVPHVKKAGIDLSLSQKDVEVIVPEAKAEVTLPDVDLKQPSANIEMKAKDIQITKAKEGSPLKFKMPTFKLPKFGTSSPSPSVEESSLDKGENICKVEVVIPKEELTVDIKPPKNEMEVSSIQIRTMETEPEEKGSKFKMPSLGFSVPQVKKPDIDLSLSQKDVEVTIPEAKAEVILPDVELKQPSADIKTKAPDIQITTKTKEGSPSKFKMPTFKFPKFGTGTQSTSVEVPDLDKDEKNDKVEFSVSEKELAVDIKPPKIEMEAPSIQMKPTETESEGKGSKFKMPSLGFSVPQVKKPDIDLSLSQKDVDVTVQEAKAVVTLPGVELKQPSADIEMKAQDIQITAKTKEGSPSKFNMPTFKLPKFGTGTPSANVEVPELDNSDKIVKVEVAIPEEELTVGIKASKIEMDTSLIQMKTIESEHKGKGSKFKMPSLGISVPQVKKPDIDFNLSQKDVEVIVPEAKAEVTLPDVELKQPSADIEMKAKDITKAKEGSPSKFKMPTFKLPKFGTGTPSARVEVPELDTGERTGKVKVDIPEEGLTVDLKPPKIEMEAPQIQIKDMEIEHREKGSKYKMPSLGFSVPRVKKPDIDLSLSQKDVDVTVPEAKAEVILPDVGLKQPSAEIEMKTPDIQGTTKTKEESPSKFKMPTFKLPKFGTGSPSASVEVPDLDKGEKTGKVEVDIPEEELIVHIKTPKIEMEASSIQIKTTETESEGKGSRFKMPSLGFGVPQVKKPEIDLSLSRKDAEVTVPAAKAEVTLPDVELKQPSADIEINTPDIQGTTKTKEESPSKFKMPTFKLPKFRTGSPSASVEVPDLDKDEKTGKVEVDIPEEELIVHIKTPKTEMEAPSIQIRTTETESEEKGRRFKMPSLGFGVPQVKKPEIDFSLSQKDVDVTVPAAKAEVTLPGVELKQPSAGIEIKNPDVQVTTKTKEGSPSKFKMPTFKLPQFGTGSPSASVEVQDLDKVEKTGKVEVDIPEEELIVHIKTPKIEMEAPSIQIKTTETESEEKGRRFKMPSLGFGVPQVKKPEIDFSLSQKDAEVTVPAAKAEVTLPDVELKQPSADIEIKTPDIQVTTKTKEGSPSKFKMPTFKLPKFGTDSPSASVEVPDLDKGKKIGKVEVDIPEEELIVDIIPPKIGMEAPSIQIKTTETESEGKGSRFKMPSLGFGVPQIKKPEIDMSLSRKDVEVTVQEAEAEVTLPDVEMKQPSLDKEIRNPDIQVTTKTKEGSPSKFKMPTFKLPKFGTGSPSKSVDVPDIDKGEQVRKIEVDIPEDELIVDIKLPKIEMETPSIQMKSTETESEGKGSRFKMPSLGFGVPQAKDVEVTVKDVKAEVALPDVELKQPSVDIKTKTPDIQIPTKTKEGSPSKFKMPTFKFPKFGTGSPSTSVEVPDLDTDEKMGKVEVNIPEEELTVEIKPQKVEMEAPSIQMKTIEGEYEEAGSRFKMPSLGFGVPQIKKPDIDLSLSQKDVKVTIPEVKAELTHPDVQLKQPSADIEMKAPEIQITAKTQEGSPSKFKMLGFKFPKFGTGTVSASVEVPGSDRGENIAKAEVNIPEEELTVDIKPPKIEMEAPSVEIKTTESEHEGKRSKFKMPSLGFSVPQVQKPDIDLSLSQKDMEVTVPEAKGEATLSDVELKNPSTEIEIRAPDIQITPRTKEGSPSKFKIPSFTLPKFGTISGATAPAEDKGVHIDGENVDLSVSIPVANVEPKVPDVELREPSSDIEIRPLDVKVTTKTKEGSPSKFKMPPFKLPKFGVGMGTATVKQDLDKGAEIDKTDIAMPEEVLTVDIKSSKVDTEPPKISLSKQSTKEPTAQVRDQDVHVSLSEEKVKVEQTEYQIKKSKFSLPRFSLSRTAVKDVEVKAEMPHVDISLQEGEVRVKQPDTELNSSDHVEVDEQTRNVNEQFGISLDGSKLSAMELSTNGEGLCVDVKRRNISVPKVQGTDLDLSLSKTNMDARAPEIKSEVELQNVIDKEPEGTTLVSNKPIVEVEAKFKRPNWSFPKFSFTRSSVKDPDVNVNLETAVDGKSCDVVKQLQKPDSEVQGSSVAVSAEESSVVELNANLKKSKFSLPKFSFSKTSVSEAEVSAELPRVDVSLREGEVKVKEHGIKEMEAPQIEIENDGQVSNIQLPKHGIALPKSIGLSEHLNDSQKDTDSNNYKVKAEINQTKTDIKSLPSGGIHLYDSETKPKDAGGSPMKIKLPTMDVQQLGGDPSDVVGEGSDGKKRVEGQNSELQNDFTLNIKGSNVEIKTDDSTQAIMDSELPKTEPGYQGLGSPSKFIFPLFKMPKLSFSRTKSEEEKVSVETGSKVEQSEIKGEAKLESSSPKMTLTSFGDMLKNIDIEFNVPKSEKEEDYPDTSKGVNADKSSEKQVEPQDQDTNTKSDATKSPGKTGGFKFPMFGFFSQSEPPKVSDKQEPKDQKSPAEEKMDEETSPTCSIQSSDAFADISSTVTSEHAALSTSSPTKATAKYSDGSDVPGFEELQSDRIISTARTELISVKPNMPEKITILSSGVSSSSEDTLKLESQKIHIITSNIQATPEAQHAKLLSAIQVQPIGGLSLKSELDSAASWNVEDSQAGTKMFERHLVRKTASESSETIVVTKQITHTSTFESSEPISGETASSIQRLRETVHSEKMRFFDGTEE